VKKLHLLILFRLLFFVVMLSSSISAETATFQYPYYLLDKYSPDGDCWMGMNANGIYQVPVVPKEWLVGPPLSDKSAVTLPTDHWVELGFRGKLIDGPGDDIFLIELGPVSEQARIFITDGAGQEYLLGLATAGSTGGGVAPTEIGFDLDGIFLPFVPCAIRILAVDMGGGSPGFDIANVRARIDSTCCEVACGPYPPNGATNVFPYAVLNWSPGCSADGHIVYLSTSFSDIFTDATPVSNPSQPQDANSYHPSGLELGRAYYWRIDEVNQTDSNDPWRGDIWRFTVPECVMIDDFEFYDNRGNPVTFVWEWRDQALLYISQGIAYSCQKSMVFNYYYDDYFYSEAVRSFSPTQDWAVAGVKVLELFFHGTASNVNPGRMYVKLSDGDANVIIPYDGDPNDIRKNYWQMWRVDLAGVTCVDLSKVRSLAIGFDVGSAQPYSYGSGTVYFDDVKMCTYRCLDGDELKADLNNDCCVDFVDLAKMAIAWLQKRYNAYPVTTPNSPILWLKFDGDASDSSGNAFHGLEPSNPVYGAGAPGFGLAFSFDGTEDSVRISDATALFSQVNNGITIAFWQYGVDSKHLVDTVCCSNYLYGQQNPAIGINLGCGRPPGRYNWDCGYPWSYDNRLSGEHRYKSECVGRWNHWVFTKDVTEGTMQIFLNGVLYDSKIGATSAISGISSFEIGSGWYGGYVGLLDDFRIYNYTLSQPEIVHVATNGTGVFNQQLMSPADLNSDNCVNFKDFAILADSWLKEQLWP